MTPDEPIKVWRYKMPPTPKGQEPRDSWSIVLVDEEGCFSILSDHGNWSHRWNPMGFGTDDMRKELLRMDAGYLRRKLSYGLGRTFQADQTIKSIRQMILYYRKLRELPKMESRLDWNAVGRVSSEFDFREFLDAKRGRWTRYMDCAVYDVVNAGGLDHWVNVSFPRLKYFIREQLEAELKKRGVPPS